MPTPINSHQLRQSGLSGQFFRKRGGRGHQFHQFHPFGSLCGGCSQPPFCVGYRPRFETWVRIRHFGALSILQPAGRSSSNLRGSKVLAKSLQTALRGPPSQQLRRPATRRPALAGFCGSSQHFRAARRLPSSSQHFRVARRPTNRRLSGQCHCPGFRIATRRPTNRLTTRRPFPNSSQAHKSLSYSQATSE